MEINITKRVIKFNSLNKNGRIYTLENIDKCLPEFITRVHNNSIYGCFADDIIDGCVNLSKATHRVRNVYIKNNNLYVEIKLLNTVHGKILQEMIKNDVYFNLAPVSIFDEKDGDYVKVKKLLSFNIVTMDDDTFLSVSDIRKIKLERINENIK